MCPSSYAAFYAPGEPKIPKWVGLTPKAVSLAGFIARVARIKVCIHRCSHWGTNKVLQAIRHVSRQEERISISQIVIDCVTFWDRPVVTQSRSDRCQPYQHDPRSQASELLQTVVLGGIISLRGRAAINRPRSSVQPAI